MVKIIKTSQIGIEPLDGSHTLTFQKIFRGSRGRPVGANVKEATRMGEDFRVVGRVGEIIVSGKEGDWFVVNCHVGYSAPRDGVVGGGPFGLDVRPSDMIYSVVSKERNPERHARLEGLLRDLEDTQRVVGRGDAPEVSPPPAPIRAGTYGLDSG